MVEEYTGLSLHALPDFPERQPGDGTSLTPTFPAEVFSVSVGPLEEPGVGGVGGGEHAGEDLGVREGVGVGLDAWFWRGGEEVEVVDEGFDGIG